MTYNRVVLGLCVEGEDDIWASALITILSAIKHSNEHISEIKISSNQKQRTAELQSVLSNTTNVPLVLVEPRRFYEEIAPPLRGSYATYWKFDLFNSLKENEILFYIDCDAFLINSLNSKVLKDIFNAGSYKLAAVPAQRPVLERWAVLKLANPFDYFNAGILFGVNDPRYREDSLRKAVSEILMWDNLSLVWHDQDIFNFMFRSDTFKLNPTFNVSTGYISNQFRTPLMINDLLGSNIKSAAVIAHMSGGYMFDRRYHPFKADYLELIHYAREQILAASDLTATSRLENTINGIKLLENNMRFSKYNYITQSFIPGRRQFSNEYYPSIRKLLGRVKRYIKTAIIKRLPI